MEERRNFIVQDENGIQLIALVLTILEIDGIEYVVYSIDKDLENSDVYVGKLVRNNDGSDRIVSIDNEEEKKNVFKIVEKMINGNRVVW